MTIYLYTKSGSKHAIDSRSMTICKNIIQLGETIFKDLDDQLTRMPSFNLKPEDLIKRQWFFRVYEGDLDSKTRKLKKVPGKKILEMLKEQDEFKSKFIKYRLRN